MIMKVTIPYHAHVITGGLEVTSPDKTTRFHLREDKNHLNDKKWMAMARNLSVKNTFPVAVAVHNVSLGSQAARANFKISKVQIELNSCH